MRLDGTSPPSGWPSYVPPLCLCQGLMQLQSQATGELELKRLGAVRVIQRLRQKRAAERGSVGGVRSKRVREEGYQRGEMRVAFVS